MTSVSVVSKPVLSAICAEHDMAANWVCFECNDAVCEKCMAFGPTMCSTAHPRSCRPIREIEHEMKTIRRDLSDLQHKVKRRRSNVVFTKQLCDQANALFDEFETRYRARKESFLQKLQDKRLLVPGTDTHTAGLSNLQIIRNAIKNNEVFLLATRMQDMLVAITELNTRPAGGMPLERDVRALDPQLFGMLDYFGVEVDIGAANPPDAEPAPPSPVPMEDRDEESATSDENEFTRWA